MNPVNHTSGPQIFRAREGGEVLEVQFLVERFCPSISTPSDLQVAESFAVWVDLNDRQRTSPCGGVSFGVTPKGLRDFRRNGFEPIGTPGRKAAVCEHMGRLIE